MIDYEKTWKDKRDSILSDIGEQYIKNVCTINKTGKKYIDGIIENENVLEYAEKHGVTVSTSITHINKVVRVIMRAKKYFVIREQQRLENEKYKDPEYSVKKIIQAMYLSKGSITDYKILSGSTPKELWSVVNEWISSGYEPQGGPYFMGASHFQAVVFRKRVYVD
ncbi:hypothetical protein AGMMS49940_15430 [Spirochaetia bacterium]|nr:hypothetical protein AGMMS49940_15430 [Spirochaetia bacterium]